MHDQSFVGKKEEGKSSPFTYTLHVVESPLERGATRPILNTENSTNCT